MKVALATDHGGYPLKEIVLSTLKKLGHEPIDFGTDSSESVDYPDFAKKAGEAVAKGEAERAILLCGSGVGICITANKIPGVYACVCHDTYTAAQGVEHDQMNALCLGGRVIGTELAIRIVESFMSARPSDAPRHLRRVSKMKAIEKEQLKG
jgi:ribose 5-phosphate isomerase B